MIFELRLALRFLRSRRRSLTRFTAAAAVIAIAAGVASLIVAQALGRGFQQEMRDRVIGSTAHVAVFRADGGEFENWRELRRGLAGIPGARQADATVYESVVLTGENGSSHAVLRVWVDGHLGDSSISVGSQLAKKLGLAVGDEANILTISSRDIGMPARPRVSNILETGVYDYDSSWIAATVEGYEKITGGVFIPTVFSVYADDPDDAPALAERIKQFLGDQYTAVSWQEANRPLFAAMTLERRASLAVVLLIIMVAALNVATTIALLVSERRADIAVLRTCGAKTKSLVMMFLLQGTLLGGVGITIGLISGAASCFLINHYGLISLPAEIYSISSVTLRPALGDAASAAAGSLVICLLASAYPAFRGSRIKPLDNLRV